MKKTRILVLALNIVFLAACSSSKTAQSPNKPQEKYKTMNDSPRYSTLTIPVQLSVAELEKTVNTYVSGVIYEDNNYDDGDGLKFKATKKDNIQLTLYRNTIKYRVPLNIWLNKKLLIGSASAEGDLVLNFKTDYQLQEDWSVQTVTTIEYHDWLRKPALKTGLGDISIQWLADLVLNKSKGELSKSIDDLVAKQLNLKEPAKAAWASIQEPILLSEEYKMWSKTTPESIGMTPFKAEFGRIEARIGVHCITEVFFGEKPKFRENKKLPDLRFVQDLPEGYEVQITTKVPYSEAKRLARLNLLGQTFESGKRKVKIEDIDLYGQDEKLVINTLLSGSYNGNIYFTGIPKFNEKKNQVEMDNLDFELETKSFLTRSAAWLFKGTIKRKLQESMAFPIEENVEDLKKQVRESLTNYVIQQGVTLNGTLDDIKVTDTFLTKEGIVVNLAATGDLLVKVAGLVE